MENADIRRVRRQNENIKMMELSYTMTAETKEGNSKGGENDGRLLIGLYYSAVTGTPTFEVHRVEGSKNL